MGLNKSKQKYALLKQTGFQVMEDKIIYRHAAADMEQQRDG